MKKTLKIAAIVLLSLVAVFILTAVIALTVLLTPSRLTQMAKKYIPDYVTCQVELGKADLVLFKSFPNVGVEIDEVAIINPMENAPSDTVVNIDKAIVSFDIWKLLRKKEIIVKRCTFENVFANIFTDEQERDNFDVFVSDSLSEGTSSTSAEYSIDLKKLKLKNATIIYTDSLSKTVARLSGMNMDLSGNLNGDHIVADFSMKVNDVKAQMADISASTSDLLLAYDGSIDSFDKIDGRLKFKTPDLSLFMGDQFLQEDTIDFDVPMKLDLSDLACTIKSAKIGLNGYVITLDGDGNFGEDGEINVDIAFSTNTLKVEKILNQIPENMRKDLLSGMTLSGDVAFSGKAVGTYNDSVMPVVNISLLANNASAHIPDMPYPFSEVNLKVDLDFDLNRWSTLSIAELNGMMNQTSFDVKGNIEDLMDEMNLDLDINADLKFADLKGVLPDNMLLSGQSDTKFSLKCKLDDLNKALKTYNFDKLIVRTDLDMTNLDLFYDDTIHMASPKMNLSLVVPAKEKINGRKGIAVDIHTPEMKVEMGNDMGAEMNHSNITATFADFMDDVKLQADLSFADMNLKYDTINFHTQVPVIYVEMWPSGKGDGALHLKANYGSRDLKATLGEAYAMTMQSLHFSAAADQDMSKEDLMSQWNPVGTLTLINATFDLEKLDEPVMIPNLDLDINAQEANIRKSSLTIGESDMNLEGRITGIDQWLNHDGLMVGEMNLWSHYLNVNEVMMLTSGLGVSVDSSEVAEMDTVAVEDNPFMVPEGLDFSFGLNIDTALYHDTEFNRLGGDLTVKDGVLVLNQVGFTSKAAEMQLTALYKTPRKNHLFLGMDFHLLNIQINDLIHMIPEIDTLVPMLKTFDGNGEFHIAAETYLKSNYEPKISTLRASADIEGRNLYVKDTTSFSKITNLLNISTKGEYKIDSIDVQLTVFRNEIDVYPFLISIGKYKAVASGRHNLDMTCNYHISVTDSPLPTRLGLDLKGSLGDLKYEIVPCKYKNLYRPSRRKDVDNQVLELKKKIADSLKANVE
jgi:Uncharacterized protein involved in outer membrane biogenesis